ncbi:MAG: MFS transporter [Clostridiales bacterium]|nr:MFS transporter [Clostridiales bacterium]
MKKTIISVDKIFRKLWIAQLISLFGDVFYDVALVWYLIAKTGSALIAGGIAIASLIGRLIGSAIISQYIDRMKSRNVMIFADSARIIALLIAMLFMSRGDPAIYVYYIISFIISFLTACFTPARAKSITEIVVEGDLPNANAFDSLSTAIVQILSWALGGVAVALFGVSVCLVIDMFSFLVSLILVVRTKWQEMKSEFSKRREIAILKVKRIVSKSRQLRSIVCFEMIYILCMGFYWASLPLKISNIGDSFHYGLQGASFGVGALITSFYLGTRKNRKIGQIYLTGISFHLLGNLLAAFTGNPYMFISLIFIGGLGSSYWQTGKVSLYQMLVSQKDYGKTISTIELLSSMLLIPAWVLGAWLSDVTSPSIIMISACIIQLITFIIFRLKTDVHRKLVRDITQQVKGDKLGYEPNI